MKIKKNKTVPFEESTSENSSDNGVPVDSSTPENNENTKNDDFVPLSGTGDKRIFGDVVFDGYCTIVNCSSSPEDKDVITLGYLNDKLSEPENDLVSKQGGEVSLTLDFMGHKISNLKTSSKTPNGYVNLTVFNEKIKNKIRLSGDEQIIGKTFRLSETSLIKGLKISEDNHDALTLASLEKLTEDLLSDYIKKNDNPISLNSSFDMTRHCINNLKSTEDETSALNLRDIKEKSLFFLSRKAKTNPELDIDIEFDGNHTVMQLGNPVEDGDIMNLRNFLIALEKTSSDYVSLKSASVFGNLDLSSQIISGIEPKQGSNTAVCLLQMKNIINSHLSYASEETVKHFYGDLVFDGKSTLKGLIDAEHDGDAVNISTVRKSLRDLNQKMAGKQGGVLINGLNCKGLKVFQLGDPILEDDGVNLRTVMKKLNEVQAVFMTPQSVSIEEDLNMNAMSIDNINSNPKKPTDAVNSLSAVNKLKQVFSTHVSTTLGRFKGNLDMNSHIISGVREGSSQGDAISLSQLRKWSEKYISVKGNDDLNPVKNEIRLSPSSKLSMEKMPQDFHEPVNLKNLRDNEKLFLSSERNDVITGDLFLGPNARISGLPEPIDERDAVTYKKSKEVVLKKSSEYIDIDNPKITGTLTITGQLKNIGNPIDISDAVNQTTLKKLLSGFISVKGLSGQQVIEKDINFQNLYRIRGIADAETDYEGVNLSSLKKEISRYLSRETFVEKGISAETLYFDDIHGLRDIKDPENKDDVVNLRTLKKLVNEKKDLLFMGKEVTFSETLDASNHRIVGLSHSDNEKSLLRLEDLIIKLNNFISLKSSVNTIINHSLHLQDEYKITGITDPVNPSDALNVQTLHRLQTVLVTKKGNDKTNPLTRTLVFSENRCKNILDAVENLDGINVSTVKKEFDKLNLIPLQETDTGIVELSEDINMQSYRVKELARATDPTDVCTIADLKTFAEDYVGLGSSNKRIEGNWRLKGKTIRNVRVPKEPGEAVNLQLLNDTLTSYLHLTKSNPSLARSLSFSGKYGIEGLSPAVSSQQAAPLSDFNKEAALFKAKYLGRTNNRVLGHIDMSFHRLFINKEAEEDNEAVILGQFEKIINRFVSSETPQGTVTGNILCNGSIKPTKMGDPELENDALTLGYLTNFPTHKTFLTDSSTEADTLDLNHHHILNLGDAVEDNDLVNLRIVKNKFSALLPLTSSIGINYDLSLSGYKIKGGATVISPKEALRLSDLKNLLSSSFEDCLSNQGDSLSYDLDMKSLSVQQFGKTINPKDALTLKETENLFKTVYEGYISLKGGSLMGNLGLNGNSVILENDSSPINDDSPVSLQASKRILDATLSDYPDSLTEDPSSIMKSEGPLDMSGHTVSSLTSSKEPGVGLTLDLLNSWIKEAQNMFLKKSDGTITASLNMNAHKISGISEGVELTDGINLRLLKSRVSAYLSSEGTCSENPLKGNVFFNELSAIKNIKNASEDNHLINLSTLKSYTEEKLKDFISIDNPIISEGLNIENSQIMNVGNPVEENDLCNLGTLINLGNNYLKTFPDESSVSIAGKIILNPDKKMINLSDPQSKNDLINFGTLKRMTSENENLFLLHDSPILQNDLDMNSNKIILSELQNNGEAVTLSVFKNTWANLKSVLNLKSSPLKKAAYMNGNGIQSLKDPLLPQSLVNLRTLKTHLDRLISIDTSLSVMRGDLTIAADQTFEMKERAVNEQDAVTLIDLNARLVAVDNNYLSRISPSFRNIIDMNNHVVSGMQTGMDDQDAVVHEQVIDEIDRHYRRSLTEFNQRIVWKPSTSPMPEEWASEGYSEIVHDSSSGFAFSKYGPYFFTCCMTSEEKLATSSKISAVLVDDENNEKTLVWGYLKASESLILSGTFTIESGMKLIIKHNEDSDIMLSRISYGIIKL